MENEIKCRRFDCIYHATKNMTYGCNYSEITGCCGLCTTVRDKIEMAKKTTEEEPKVRKTMYDWEKGLQLYKSGLSDSSIARELGCKAPTVLSWRRRFGLPPNFGRGGRLSG